MCGGARHEVGTGAEWLEKGFLKDGPRGTSAKGEEYVAKEEPVGEGKMRRSP